MSVVVKGMYRALYHTNKNKFSNEVILNHNFSSNDFKSKVSVKLYEN